MVQSNDHPDDCYDFHKSESDIHSAEIEHNLLMEREGLVPRNSRNKQKVRRSKSYDPDIDGEPPEPTRGSPQQTRRSPPQRQISPSSSIGSASASSTTENSTRTGAEEHVYTKHRIPRRSGSSEESERITLRDPPRRAVRGDLMLMRQASARLGPAARRSSVIGVTRGVERNISNSRRAPPRVRRGNVQRTQSYSLSRPDTRTLDPLKNTNHSVD